MDVPMTYAYAISLYKILNKVMYIENGDEQKERDIPFVAKYKLQRDLDIVLKDYLTFQEERTTLVKKYGVEEGDTITVKEENNEVFKNDLVSFLNSEVSHSLSKLTVEEVCSLGNDIDLDNNELNLFIAFIVDDPELTESTTPTDITGKDVELEK